MPVAVLMVPPYLQFFDDEGRPLSGGKVYTYTATGTFTTPKATYTTASGDTEADNPVILDGAGRPQSGGGSMWISGTYDFKVTDSLDNTIETTLNVTAFNTLPSQSNAYFQSFSGNGSQTAFTTSSDLGADEKAIYVWVDNGLTDKVGYQIQNPSAYTIDGTTLTFGSPPAVGTGNIYVSAPSLLVGAASSSAADAAASAASAMASEIAAGISETGAGDSATAAATSASDAATSAGEAAISSEWATKTTGLVDGTDYSSKAWAIGGTGTTTNSSKYWAGQAAALALGSILNMANQSVTPGTPTSGNSKLYFKTDKRLYSLDDTGLERPVGNWVLLQTKVASNSANITFDNTVITSTYKTYAVIMEDIIPVSLNTRLRLFFSINNGSSTLTGSVYGHIAMPQSGSNSYSGFGQSAADSVLLSSTTAGAVNSSYSGELKLFNLSASLVTKMASTGATLQDTNVCYMSDVSASVQSASAINFLQYEMITGNISSGTFKLYGIL